MNQKDSIRELLARKPQPLMSQDGVPELEKRVLFRLGHASGWKWTAYEAEEQDGDIRCFGRVDGWESELGYFSVDEVLDNGGFRLAARTWREHMVLVRHLDRASLDLAAEESE